MALSHAVAGGMVVSFRRWWWLPTMIGGLVVYSLGAPRVALARSNGIVASSCTGCHGGASSATLGAVASPSPFLPGDEVVIEITVRATSMVSAGIYIESEEGVGTFRALPGEGLAQVSTGLTHSTPKRASNGAAVFRFAWRAPDSPGAVRFNVFALAANGDGFSFGDRAGSGEFDFVFGCEPRTSHLDNDWDGFGVDRASRVVCVGQPVAGWADVLGDCDDTRPEVYPGAPELCNKRDDDCDGAIDEDAELVDLWPDPDGDGYFADREGEAMRGCVTRGYAAEPGDCDEGNAAIHPGAEEVCNGYDDNCDGRVDERVRPRCGEGWCTRESLTCDPKDCTPGEPTPERCNGRDDDCNGSVDEGETCPAGEVCVAGECMTADGVAPGGAPGDGGVVIAPPSESPRRSKGCSVTRSKGPEDAWMIAVLLVLGIRMRHRRGRKEKPREGPAGWEPETSRGSRRRRR